MHVVAAPAERRHELPLKPAVLRDKHARVDLRPRVADTAVAAGQVYVLAAVGEQLEFAGDPCRGAAGRRGVGAGPENRNPGDTGCGPLAGGREESTHGRGGIRATGPEIVQQRDITTLRAGVVEIALVGKRVVD